MTNNVAVATLILCACSFQSAPVIAATVDEWGRPALSQEAEWYGGDEARQIAATLLRFQSSVGAWPKNTDFLAPATDEEISAINRGGRANTIDNDATTEPLRFLARVAQQTGDPALIRAFERGVDYLLEAQYDNGGWPQFYPLREGYYSHVTYNDNAMINVMFLLRDVAAGGEPYSFVDAERRSRAAAAVELGIECILRTQLRQDGVLTAWAAQYDEHTLEPAWARAYEPPSLSGNESVAIVRFLMELEDPTPEQVAAIEGAVRWLDAVAVRGLRYVRSPDVHGRYDAWVIEDPNSGPIWARFYEIDSNRPIFLGRDSVVRYSLAEIEAERRGGYAYYGTWPQRLLEVDYPSWQAARSGTAGAAVARVKPRVFVLTDIENEPDDAMSMVRFLVYGNQWDVEGLVATTSIHQQDETAAWRIREIVDAYDEVRDNLEAHEHGFPPADQLRARIREGLPAYGMAAVGEGMDSPGSELLIEVVDRDDPRPVWVTVWGGPNVLAQALWKIRETRSAEELDAFVAKLRVYTISDQDDSGPWLRRTFPGLHYIVSPGMHSGGAYHYATWSGIGGDNFHARFVGADFSLVDNPWLDEHIRSKGPLGAQYPHMPYLMEGDTPSFFNLIDNGLSDPEHPDWGGWGGRYEFYTPPPHKRLLYPETRPFWSDAMDEVLGVDGQWHTSNHATIWRWRTAYQNDFVARMDWTIKPYGEANHPPVPALGHSDRLTAAPGARVHLSAAGRTDPDGDELFYEWFLYKEPGTFTVSSARSGQPLTIENADRPDASFVVPTSRVLRNGTMHIILAVTDNGSPALTRYERVIVEVGE